MNNSFKLIIPAIPQDIEVFLNNASYFFDFLAISKIVFIGPSSIKDGLPSDERYEIIDENDVLDITALKSLYAQKLNVNTELKKFGWYVQQFLKMAYSLRCKEDYYLLWDADTIPLKAIHLFDDYNKPFLDYKTEYNEPYFKTIATILPGYSKTFRGSFIAEHMLIKASIMKDLIRDIENNTEIEGSTFDQIIINSIDSNDLTEGGYSEFETYGTYVIKKFKDAYTLRRWRSMRYGGYFFEHNQKLGMSSVTWISKHYEAVSIEKWSPVSSFSSITNKRWFQCIFPSTVLEIMALFIRIKKRVVRRVARRK